MQSLSSLKRIARLFGLAVFMLNILIVPVGASDFDLDEDGMDNDWETLYGLNPNDASDAATDLDGDTLSNLAEYGLTTDPTNVNTDGDTWDDGEEITNGTDPLVFEAADLDILDIMMDPVTGMISYVATNLGNVDVDYTVDAGYTGVYINYGEADETLYYYDWNTEMGASSWVGTFFTAGGSETIDSGVGLISGEHSVMVCIDRAANHGEFASGFDNCEIESFSVGADLSVTDISFVADDTVPGQFFVYTDLANTGDIDADATLPGSITTTLNGGSEQVYNWTSLDPSLQGFLAANGTTVDFESLGFRPLLVDGDVIEVCVDSGDLVTELDESNNCLTATYTDGPLTVEAGVDEGFGIGTIYNLAAYAEGAASLTSATVDWGDSSALETVTQTLDGDRINLGATHLYDHRETFTITVCATEGIETVCDTLHLSITGSSSSSSSSSSGSSSSSSTDTSTDSGSSSTDEDVDLAGEEDQDVTLTEDDEVVDCTEMAFEDVAEGDELYDAICELWGTDVIHGKTANFFDFEDVIRRDEASKIFTRWFGYVTVAYEDTPAAEGTFSDVEATDSLAYYVEVADGEGLVTGNTDSMEVDGEVVSESTFNPHDAITAQEIADALKEILGDNTAGEQLDEDGYVSEDSMTRGSFVELLYGLSR